MPGDYPTIRQLGGSIVDLRRYADEKNKLWSATNASIGYYPKKGFVVAFRSSNYILEDGIYKPIDGPIIRSHVWFAELDKEFKVKNMRKIDFSEVSMKLDRGVEDPKLFFRDGTWQFTCVVYETDHTPFSRMAVAKLDPKATKVVSLKKFPGADYKLREKNWMLPYEENPNFDFIYSPNSTVKDGVLTTHMIDSEELSGLRGSSNLHSLGDGTYLAVLHRRFGKNNRTWDATSFAYKTQHDIDYVHYFARYDEFGAITALSKGFQFHAPGVEFAAGLTVREKNFIVSFGRNDVSSHLAVIPVETVIKSLRPVMT